MLLVGFAVDEDFARGFGDEVEAGFEEGGFAGSVGANDADELAFGDIEVEIPEDGLAVVGDGEVVNREGEFGWVVGEHGWQLGGLVGNFTQRRRERGVTQRFFELAWGAGMRAQVSRVELVLEAFCGGGAAEGAGDGGDVVVDHAEVGSFVGVGGAHRVGVEFAADDDGVALGGGTFDKGLDAFVGDRAFDEDGGNVFLNEVGDEVFDLFQPGFGFGGDPLNTTDLEAVGATEVGEGIVRGDEDALVGGDGAEGRLRVGVEIVKACLVGGEALLVDFAVVGIELGDLFGDAGGDL